MGIDIYAHWRDQSNEAKAKQSEAWLSTGAGGAGYLREAYHGAPYATKYLCTDNFVIGKRFTCNRGDFHLSHVK
jgi:hypothetical protein